MTALYPVTLPIGKEPDAMRETPHRAAPFVECPVRAEPLVRAIHPAQIRVDSQAESVTVGMGVSRGVLSVARVA